MHEHIRKYSCVREMERRDWLLAEVFSPVRNKAFHTPTFVFTIQVVYIPH